MSHYSERRALKILVSDQVVFLLSSKERCPHRVSEGPSHKMENVPAGFSASGVGSAIAVAIMAAVIAVMEKRILIVEMMVLC